ncbi:MAG TPA: Gldg family protein [Candidatus Paceibacterota bacterium]|nr:Gldg family protein [Verrucomicrobiota bacterium]HSA10101.1 Gldg family protein [Candidatus Paceibacterota bacterium]
MATDLHPRPSFSPYLKWGIGLHVLVLALVVLAVVVMINYISQEYFLRFHLSTRTKIELSPRTVSLLRSLTNQVKVTLYYDTEDDDALYSTVAELLAEYRLVNPKLTVQTVDYVRDPGLAQKTKLNYSLAAPTDKNLVIFDCGGKVKVVDGNGLARYVIERVEDQESRAKELKFRRKPAAFMGEVAFTAALLDVTSPKPLKAYFLQGHGEHQMDSGDEVSGYLKFASILEQNCIKPVALSLLGTNAVPGDCNLLVIAGPRDGIPDAELVKIERYLNQGGRLLALFNFGAVRKDTGLEQVLAKWGVDVGHNVVTDPDNTIRGTDVIVSRFGEHPLVNSLQHSRLHLSWPRAVGRLKLQADAADAPRVDEVAFTGPRALASGDSIHKAPFPLLVAVEKETLRDVITEHGSTRMVIVGDSVFLGNLQIESAANRDFAGNAVNWLLERTQLLAGLGPRPITQYKIVMTKAQLRQAQWVLLGVLPGSALALGGLVWLRRRR